MEESPWYTVIIMFIAVLYLMPVYMFLGPGLVGFILQKRDGSQKGLQFLAFLVTPFLLPFGLAAALMVVAFAFAVLFIAYPIYWLRIYLPFGGVFKAWYRISWRLLARVRVIFESLLGLNFPVLPDPLFETVGE